MKWIWIVLGTLAAIVALVVIIGALLPVKHVASRRTRFNKPPEQVERHVPGHVTSAIQTR